MATSKRKRFELKDARHNKFWEFQVAGASVMVRFGRLGSAGVEKATKFTGLAEAERAAAKLVAQETKKGYRPEPGRRRLPAPRSGVGSWRGRGQPTFFAVQASRQPPADLAAS